jgi:hypothetical protein
MYNINIILHKNMKNKPLVIVPMAPIFVNVPNNILLRYVYDAKFVIPYQISIVLILYISHKYLKCDIVYIIMQSHNIIISLRTKGMTLKRLDYTLTLPLSNTF